MQPRLINIYKLVILTIREIQKRLLSKSCVSRMLCSACCILFCNDNLLIRVILIHGPICRIHGVVDNNCLLSVAHTLLRLQLVQHNEVGPLDGDNGHERHEDGQAGAEAGLVGGRVVGVEEQRPDDVAGRAGGVVDAHDGGFLGGAGGVADDPGDDQGVAAEEEGQEVVAHEESRLGRVVARHGVEDGEAGDDGDHEEHEDGALDTRLLSEVAGQQDDNDLQGAERHVEQAGHVLVGNEAVEDERPESVGHAGADVEQQSHGDPQVCLGLHGGLEELSPLELSASSAGLVGTESLDGLCLFLFGEESSGRDVIFELPVDEGG